jgi:urease accessory protein
MAEFAGQLSLRASVRPDGRTVLSQQSFRAPFHLSKPYWAEEEKVLMVQVVNPTAGILSGDRLDSSISVDPGAALLVTTPSASRVFKMVDGVAECHQRFSVGSGAWLEVMPEPLVPHRASNYQQVTEVDVADGGSLFFVDQLMPGRVAHGETWSWSRLRLKLRVNYAGHLILRERLDQAGDDLRQLAILSGSGPEACFANAILVTGESSHDPAWRHEVAALHGEGLWLGLSALTSGGWSIKMVATDNIGLRRALKAVRAILAKAFPRLAFDPRKL